MTPFLASLSSISPNSVTTSYSEQLTLTNRELKAKDKSEKMRSEEDPHTRALHDLWSMMLHTFRSPPFPIPRPQISPASFGLLFIGISMALMFFGIVTFFIGFVLMPLVIMLVVFFYFIAIVSKVLETGRSILWPVSDYNKVAPVWSYSS